LIKDVKQGYYVEAGRSSFDQQLLNVQFIPKMMHEINNGKLGKRVIDAGIQFTLPHFWQNVATLGGSASGTLSDIGVDSPDLDRLVAVGTWAVPAMIKQLNVINNGKEA
jgi:predicted Zn-dependent protease